MKGTVVIGFFLCCMHWREANSFLSGTTVIPLPSTTAPSLSLCPADIKRDSNLRANGINCYEFVLHNETTWYTARNECIASGGSLVMPKDYWTMIFIERTLVELNYTGAGIWMGLHHQKVNTRRVWEWVDGTELGKFANWVNDYEKFGYLDDCAHTKTDSGGAKWFSNGCHSSNYDHVCQYDIPGLSRPTETTSPMQTTESTMTVTETTTSPTTSATKVTTKSITTTMAAESTTVCGAFVCQKDCGILGYRVGPDGCPLCECQQ